MGFNHNGGKQKKKEKKKKWGPRTPNTSSSHQVMAEEISNCIVGTRRVYAVPRSSPLVRGGRIPYRSWGRGFMLCVGIGMRRSIWKCHYWDAAPGADRISLGWRSYQFLRSETAGRTHRVADYKGSCCAAAIWAGIPLQNLTLDIVWLLDSLSDRNTQQYSQYRIVAFFLP